MSDTENAGRLGHAPKLRNDSISRAHRYRRSHKLPFLASGVVATGHASQNYAPDTERMVTDLDHSAIGQRIRALRLERNENQYDLAAAAHVSRPTVTEWENGRKTPGREKIAAVAKHFGVPVDFILYGGALPSTVQVETEEEVQLLLLSRKVSPEVRRAVRTLLENSADLSNPVITKS